MSGFERFNKTEIFVSIVMPVLNEEKFIGNTLQQIARQEYSQSKLEIIVVDGGSVDKTKDIVRAFIAATDLNIRLLENPNKLSSSARNIGIKNAVGDYIMFIDGHIYLPNNLTISEMVTAALKNEARILGRPQPLNPPGLNSFQMLVAAVRSSSLGHSVESYIYSDYEGWVNPTSVSVMYHRSIFEEFGGFDESFDAAEDLEFNYRLSKNKLRAFFSPKFSVYYYPRDCMSGLYVQMQRYGLGRIKFSKKHPESFNFEVLAPCLAVLTAFMSPILVGLLYESALHGLLTIAVLVSCACWVLSRILKVSNPLFVLSSFICLLIVYIGLSFGIFKGICQSIFGRDRRNDDHI